MSNVQNVNHNTIDLNRAIEFALYTAKLRAEGIEHLVPYVVGPPGGGKTMLFKSECDKMNYGLLSYTPALERLEKFGGIPERFWKKTDNESDKELHTVWSVPQLIGEVREKTKNYETVVVLFDDWHLCSADIQQIGFELFTHYSLNGHKIPKNVLFCLAGNETSAAGAKIQLTAIKNRCKMFFTKSSPIYWVENFATRNNIHESGIMFFSNPSNYDIFHMQESSNSQFASPRSWTSMFNYIKHLEMNKVRVTKSELLHIMSGCVGAVAATRFFEFYKIYSSIDVKSVFDKNIISIPENPVDKFAAIGAVSAEFYKRFHDEDKRDPASTIFFKYVEKLSEENEELAIKAIKIIKNKPGQQEYNVESGVSVITHCIKKKFLNIKLANKIISDSSILNKIN